MVQFIQRGEAALGERCWGRVSAGLCSFLLDYFKFEHLFRITVYLCSPLTSWGFMAGAVAASSSAGNHLPCFKPNLAGIPLKGRLQIS